MRVSAMGVAVAAAAQAEPHRAHTARQRHTPQNLKTRRARRTRPVAASSSRRREASRASPCDLRSSTT
eukprot:scaffold50471_cov62-Phaeocystis_antarctica.AAC.3